MKKIQTQTKEMRTRVTVNGDGGSGDEVCKAWCHVRHIIAKQVEVWRHKIVTVHRVILWFVNAFCEFTVETPSSYRQPFC